jgi:hypothetical protein
VQHLGQPAAHDGLGGWVCVHHRTKRHGQGLCVCVWGGVAAGKHKQCGSDAKIWMGGRGTAMQGGWASIVALKATYRAYKGEGGGSREARQYGSEVRI